jgi:Lon protease-like protein
MGGQVFPGQPVALHLFEPRYRLLVERLQSLCVGERRLGYVHTGTPAPGTRGCVVQVSCISQLPTGTYVLKGMATDRFVATETWVAPDSAGLWYAQTRLIPDDADVKNAVALLQTVMQWKRYSEQKLEQGEAASVRDSSSSDGNICGLGPGSVDPTAAKSARVDMDVYSFANAVQSLANQVREGRCHLIAAALAQSQFATATIVSTEYFHPEFNRRLVAAADAVAAGRETPGGGYACPGASPAPAAVPSAAAESLGPEETRRLQTAAVRQFETTFAMFRNYVAVRIIGLAICAAVPLCMRTELESTVGAIPDLPVPAPIPSRPLGGQLLPDDASGAGAADEAALVPPPPEMLEAAVTELHAALPRLSPSLLVRLSFWIPSILPLPAELKARLATIESLGERLWVIMQVAWPYFGQWTGIDIDAISDFVMCGDAGSVTQEQVLDQLRRAELQLRERKTFRWPFNCNDDSCGGGSSASDDDDGDDSDPSGRSSRASTAAEPLLATGSAGSASSVAAPAAAAAAPAPSPCPQQSGCPLLRRLLRRRPQQAAGAESDQMLDTSDAPAIEQGAEESDDAMDEVDSAEAAPDMTVGGAGTEEARRLIHSRVRTGSGTNPPPTSNPAGSTPTGSICVRRSDRIRQQ